MLKIWDTGIATNCTTLHAYLQAAEFASKQNAHIAQASQVQFPAGVNSLVFSLYCACSQVSKLPCSNNMANKAHTLALKYCHYDSLIVIT